MSEVSSKRGVPLYLTEDNFDSTVNAGEQPVLVDFWAAWCAPCRMIAPVLDELAAELQGQAVIAKVDVDQVRGPARDYGIASIPTLIIFKDGREVDRLIGVQSKDVIRKRLLNATNAAAR